MQFTKPIIYQGIRTNILNNINIKINPGSITYIGGASGSGKSSLAFKTISDISEYEYSLLEGALSKSYEFELDSYEGIRMVIPLQQLNFNTNSKSSILTYFGLKSSLLTIVNSFRAFQKQGKIGLGIYDYCPNCAGDGYVKSIDIIKSLDRKKALNNQPFKHWNNTYKDFYKQLLTLYLNEVGIDGSKCFDELSDAERNQILNGYGSINYKITYKYGHAKKVKTSKYVPVVEEFGKSIFNSNYNEYSKKLVCPECNGARFNNKIIRHQIFQNISLQDLLLMNLNELNVFLKSLDSEKVLNSFAVTFFERFLSNCIKLGLGHLSISRGISSVSGGELQRLRMAKLLSGSLSDIVLVLDEPSASLHPDEVVSLLRIIRELSNNCTLVIVDHNRLAAEIADNKYYLLRNIETNVSNIVDVKIFDKSQLYDLKYVFFKSTYFESIVLNAGYIQYENELELPFETLVGVCGLSGSGKSTILKEILPSLLDNYIYVSQKPIKGNINSTVGSYIGIIDDLKKDFFKHTSLTKDLLTTYSCKYCRGKGVINSSNYYGSPIQIICDSCRGSGYSSALKQYKLNGISFDRLLSEPVEILLKNNLTGIHKRIVKKMRILSELGLGYISLNRKITSLSGGENQRVKMIKHLNLGYEVIGLDEPCQGLDEVSIKRFIQFIYQDIEVNKRTYIVAEHNPLFLQYTSYLIELNKSNDKRSIVYQGMTREIQYCKDSKISKWL